jgi:hypothetical protein
MNKTETIATRSDWVTFRCLLAAHRTFNTYGALRGERTQYVSSYGRLPAEHAAALRECEQAGRLAYVVYSYATPIAWNDTEHGWTMPSASYSVTTSHHQSKIRTAVAELSR